MNRLERLNVFVHIVWVIMRRVWRTFEQTHALGAKVHGEKLFDVAYERERHIVIALAFPEDA